MWQFLTTRHTQKRSETPSKAKHSGGSPAWHGPPHLRMHIQRSSPLRRCHPPSGCHNARRPLADNAETRASISTECPVPRAPCLPPLRSWQQQVEPRRSSILRLRQFSPRARRAFDRKRRSGFFAKKHRPVYLLLWAITSASAAIVAAFVGLHRGSRDRGIWHFFSPTIRVLENTRKRSTLLQRATVFGEGKMWI